MKNKKGNMLVGGLIVLLVTIIIITTVAIPLIKNSTDSQATTEELIYVNTSVNQSFILTETDLESGELSIAGLTVTSNYTIDYDTATVKILLGTTVDTYTVSYNYYGATYLESTSNRAGMGLVIIVLLFGIVYYGGKMFGMID